MNETETPRYRVGKSLRFMLGTAWRHGKSVPVMCLVIAAVQIALNMAQLYIAPQILNRVETAAPLPQLFGTILVFSAVIFFLTALRQYCDYAVTVSRIWLRTVIVQKINHKALTTSYPNCFDPDRKALLGKALTETEGNTQSTEYIWTTLTELLTNLGCFALYLITLSSVGPMLIVISVVTCLLASLLRMRTERKYAKRQEAGKFWRQFDYLKRSAESVEKAKDIRLFGLGNWIRELYDDVLRAQAAFVHEREAKRIAAAVFGVVMTLLQNGAAYAYLLKLTLDGGLSASEFLLYFTAISGFTAWVSGILENCTDIYRQTQGIGTVIEYLNSDEPFRFSGGRALPDTTECELKLEDVSFAYPGAEKNLFEHLNLTIHPGEKLAVVGLNGAGKSTLVKLLCGFYEPDEGRVTLNGIDIREFNRDEYYRLLCAVFQEFSVLDVTIAENVAQSIETVDEDKVWQCLELAGLAEFVKTLKDGLHTNVGREVHMDGVLFSGGQMQRLMLARALYKGGPILILDEPTAALDPIAENDIYQKYNEMTRGKTSLFISHRLASTRFCDRIIFIADGKIAEEGTHEQLLKQGGAYAQLFEVQSRYYQEGAEFRGEKDEAE